MAVPKRKTSKAKKRSRGANWKLSIPGVTACSTCGTIILAHRVCKNCGSYAGRKVVEEA